MLMERTMPKSTVKPFEGVETNGSSLCIFLGCVCGLANFVIPVKCWKCISSPLQPPLHKAEPDTSLQAHLTPRDKLASLWAPKEPIFLEAHKENYHKPGFVAQLRVGMT